MTNPSAPRRPSARAPWLQRAMATGISIRTAAVSRRLRAQADVGHQLRTWRTLMRRFAATQFGRAAGLEQGVTYQEFDRRIAPQTYEQLAPWIERMKRGEADVLWPGTCAHYAVSSGTTSGRTKYLPITDAMIAHFRRAGLDSLCFYAQRRGNAQVFLGRHLFLGGSTSLAPLPGTGNFRAWGGDLSGITALHLPGWAERNLFEPGRDIAAIADWPTKLRAMVERTAGRNITLLAGIPSWILVLAEQMRRHSGKPDLKSVWPQLDCLVHGGVPVTPFVDELQAALGRGVNFHEVYPASEGFIAAQDGDAAEGLRLITNAGIFYEFLPMNRFDAGRLSALSDAVVSLDEVQPGVDYALLMTTPGGLCRYVIGDVVRFVTTKPPRLLYVGRTQLQLSAFGEHVIEKELTDTIAAVASGHGVAIANFHVAPVFVDSTAGVHRGRHEWWIEFCAGRAPEVSVATLAKDCDAELQRRNDDYEAKRQGGGLDQPVARIVAPGTFERWMKQRGKWGGQNKMPRCRSDRLVAEELRALAR